MLTFGFAEPDSTLRMRIGGEDAKLFASEFQRWLEAAMPDHMNIHGLKTESRFGWLDPWDGPGIPILFVDFDFRPELSKPLAATLYDPAVDDPTLVRAADLRLNRAGLSELLQAVQRASRSGEPTELSVVPLVTKVDRRWNVLRITRLLVEQ